MLSDNQISKHHRPALGTQSLLPVWEHQLCWPRLRRAPAHRIELLVVADPAGSDDGKSPSMQESRQLPVAGRLTRGGYSFLILTEELGAFTLWQVPKNNFGVI